MLSLLLLLLLSLFDADGVLLPNSPPGRFRLKSDVRGLLRSNKLREAAVVVVVVDVDDGVVALELLEPVTVSIDSSESFDPFFSGCESPECDVDKCPSLMLSLRLLLLLLLAPEFSGLDDAAVADDVTIIGAAVVVVSSFLFLLLKSGRPPLPRPDEELEELLGLLSAARVVGAAVVVVVVVLLVVGGRVDMLSLVRPPDDPNRVRTELGALVVVLVVVVNVVVLLLNPG